MSNSVDPIDGSPPGFPVPGILQARTLEWVAISFSNAWKWKVKGKLLSRVWLFATPWTEGYQAPPSMGFSRQKYWSGVPLPSPWNIIDANKSLLNEWRGSGLWSQFIPLSFTNYDFGSVTSASLNLNFLICKWEKNDTFLDDLPVLLTWSSHILADLG